MSLTCGVKNFRMDKNGHNLYLKLIRVRFAALRDEYHARLEMAPS